MSVTTFQETAGGSPRLPPQRGPELNRPREPMFNAPWPVVALAALILGGYALQSRFPQDLVVSWFGFAPVDLTNGRSFTLVTAMFLHGNWAHALMNAGFGLAFAAPVTRYFGERAPGLLGFLVFYLGCGVLANLGYAAMHPGETSPLVGASGAIAGLMGAASRLIAVRGRLSSIFSPPVLAMGAAWVLVNLLFAVLGASAILGTGGAPVAWEAHLTGFLVGVLSIGVMSRLVRRG